MGSVSAAMTTTSLMPRLRVLVAARGGRAWCMQCRRELERLAARCQTFGGAVGRACSAAEGRTFVGALLQLLVVGRLLDDVHDGVGELQQGGGNASERREGLAAAGEPRCALSHLRIRQRVGLGVHSHGDKLITTQSERRGGLGGGGGGGGPGGGGGGGAPGPPPPPPPPAGRGGRGRAAPRPAPGGGGRRRPPPTSRRPQHARRSAAWDLQRSDLCLAHPVDMLVLVCQRSRAHAPLAGTCCVTTDARGPALAAAHVHLLPPPRPLSSRSGRRARRLPAAEVGADQPAGWPAAGAVHGGGAGGKGECGPPTLRVYSEGGPGGQAGGEAGVMGALCGGGLTSYRVWTGSAGAVILAGRLHRSSRPPSKLRRWCLFVRPAQPCYRQ